MIPEESKLGTIQAQMDDRSGRAETITDGAQLLESDRRENGANITDYEGATAVGTEHDGATAVSTGKVPLKFGREGT